MKIKDKEIQGLVLIVLAGIFWGTSGTFGSILMDADFEECSRRVKYLYKIPDKGYTHDMV